MLALLLVASAGALGAGVVRRLRWPLSRFEAVALTGAVALTVPPWILFVAAWSLGFDLGLPVACVAMAAGGWHLARGHATAPAIEHGPRASSLSWIALAILFALLFHGHMLHAERDGLYTGGSAYGDLALHTSLASRFAVDEVSFASPIADGEALTYPFLGDFLVASLVRGGLAMGHAFALTGWLSAMVMLAFVDALAQRIFARRSAGVIAVWTIVLSGSAAGLALLGRDLAANGIPVNLGDLPNYAHLRDRGLVLANLVCDFLLPQRAFLSALPGFWAAVWALRLPGARGAPVATGLVVGLLPFFHVHSFLIAIALVAWIGLWRAALARRVERAWAAGLVVALVVAAPQLAWQFGHSWQRGFGRWDVGWLAAYGDFAWFWVRNLGAVLVLSPFGLWLAMRTRDRFTLPFFLAAPVVFVAINLYTFQPHDWDNMKFFVYAYMIVAVVLAGVLAEALAHGGWRRLAAAVAIAAMTGSGAAAIAREADLHDRIATTEDVRLAARLRAVLPPDALVATADQHNHVVPMLAGRRVVLGYRGWLWTHGVDARPLSLDVGRVFAGGPAAEEVIARRRITHVFIGPGEVRERRADAAWFRARYPVVASGDGVEVFDVRRPARVHLASRGGLP